MRCVLSILMLTAMLVQSLSLSLPEKVVICLGGGHQHETPVCDVPAPPACCSGCTHESFQPSPPPTSAAHDADCACTDIELALLDLDYLPSRSTGLDSADEATTTPPLDIFVREAQGTNAFAWSAPPPGVPPEINGVRAHHLPVMRCTRLLL